MNFQVPKGVSIAEVLFEHKFDFCSKIVRTLFEGLPYQTIDPP